MSLSNDAGNHANNSNGDPEITASRAMDRRRAIASLLLPGAALLGGCASAVTAKPSAIAVDSVDPRFDDRPGAFIMQPDGTRAFRNHILRDQDGNVVRYQDDLIEGQIFAATFMYVNCKGICADMTSKMAQAYDILTPVMGKPVRFYSFSLAEDSPAQMKEYMEARGLYGRPGWTFLTASESVMKDIRWGFGFMDVNEEIDNNRVGHTGMVRVGNHKLDRWSSCPALSNPVVTARSVISLYPPGQRPHIAALERVEPHPARAIPGYQPVGPSSQAPSQASSQASPL